MAEGGEGLSTEGQFEPVSSQTESAALESQADVQPERNMTSREEASNKLGDAQNLIQEYLDRGFLGNEGENKYTKAQTALSYKGTGGASTKEASRQIEALINCVREIAREDKDAQEINVFFAKNVKVFNQQEDKTYSLSDWEEQLISIYNDNSLDEKERIHKTEELKKDAFYGFVFRKEEVQTQEQQKSAEDKIVSDYRKSFEEEFKKAEERGDVSKEQMEKIGETLIMLRLAEEANGDAGVIFKHLALKNLAEDHGAQGLDGVINDLQEKAPAAIDKVCEVMPSDKAQEFRNAIKEGKLEDMIKSRKLFKIEGMRELIFGKDLTEEKLKEMLGIDKKKKWKDPLLLALIILLIGPMEMGKEVVPLPK